MKLFVTDTQLSKRSRDAYHLGYEAGTKSILDAMPDTLEQVRQESYNKGKAEGIAQAKRAFALALKQKGESNNVILR